MNKLAFFTMDVEDFTDIECLKGFSFDKTYDVSDGITNYLNLLEKYNIKANLFVIVSYAKKIKELLDKAINNNHKIAVHGYSHIPCRLLDDKEFTSNIKLAKKEINEMFKINCLGFRAPCFSLNSNQLNILKENGFVYDSSYMNYKNTYYKGNISFNIFKEISDNIYYDNEIFEFSLPVYQHFPLGGGGYLRIAPWFFVKHQLKKYLKTHNTYIFYLHPFEVSTTVLPKIKQLHFYDKMYLNFNRKKYLNRIEKIIQLLIKNGFEFKNFEDFIKKDIK